MNIIVRLSAVALSAALLGCTTLGLGSPSTVTGKLAANTAKNPKLAVVTAEGNSLDDALAVMQAKAGTGTLDNKLPLAYTIKPKSDGTYTMELKSTKSDTLFYVYGWDDVDDNDKVNNPEALSGKASGNVDFYIFYKSKTGTQEITQDGKAVAMKSSYDWNF